MNGIDYTGGIERSAHAMLGDSMAREMDSVIRNAINQFIGNSSWSVDQIAGRGRIERYITGVEIFVLDDVPLVEFYPINTERKDGVIHAWRNHRMLFSTPKAPNVLD